MGETTVNSLGRGEVEFETTEKSSVILLIEEDFAFFDTAIVDVVVGMIDVGFANIS